MAERSEIREEKINIIKIINNTAEEIKIIAENNENDKINIGKIEEEKINNKNNKNKIEKEKEKIIIDIEKEEEKSAAEKFSESIKKAIAIFRERNQSKIRAACKILRNKNTPQADLKIASDLMMEWIREGIDQKNFAEIIKPFLNCLFAIEETAYIKSTIKFFIIFFSARREIVGDDDYQRVLKNIFGKFSERFPTEFISEWEKFLLQAGTKISSDFVCDWIKTKARKGKIAARQLWENFQRNFTTPLFSTTQSDGQSCVITTRTGLTGEGHAKNFPESAIIWNGNGVRARWTAPSNELKKLIDKIGPDFFVFIESKTDAQKLLALQGFEEWANGKGFIKIYCHWSTHESKTAHGAEGILILTKIPCEVSYGIGHPEFDKQARVALIEFPKIFILVSYNPQGGFEQKSLAFRTEWEKVFKNFLGGLRERAGRMKKGVVWAGDFNVCPSSEDWTQRAFDHIRKKVPAGTDPTGCRKIDQDSYREMLLAIDGYNVAEFFSDGPQKRTCFPNELGLKLNHGQRLDHVVAQGCLLDNEAGPKILDFDVVQEFGGGRKFCSDHCPLWINFGEWGEKEKFLLEKEKVNTPTSREREIFVREKMREKSSKEKERKEREIFAREKLSEQREREFFVNSIDVDIDRDLCALAT